MLYDSQTFPLCLAKIQFYSVPWWFLVTGSWVYLYALLKYCVYLTFPHLPYLILSLSWIVSLVVSLVLWTYSKGFLKQMFLFHYESITLKNPNRNSYFIIYRILINILTLSLVYENNDSQSAVFVLPLVCNRKKSCKSKLCDQNCVIS